MATGEIEVRTVHFKVLNLCETPPFTPGQPDLPGEDLRLKYRFLDLRRQEMQRSMVLRSQIGTSPYGTTLKSMTSLMSKRQS